MTVSPFGFTIAERFCPASIGSQFGNIVDQVATDVAQAEDCLDYGAQFASAGAQGAAGAGGYAFELDRELGQVFLTSKITYRERYGKICSVQPVPNTYPYIGYEYFHLGKLYYFDKPLAGAGTSPEMCVPVNTANATVTFSNSTHEWYLFAGATFIETFSSKSYALRAMIAVKQHPHHCYAPNTSDPPRSGTQTYWY